MTLIHICLSKTRLPIAEGCGYLTTTVRAASETPARDNDPVDARRGDIQREASLVSALDEELFPGRHITDDDPGAADRGGAGRRHREGERRERRKNTARIRAES